jgi:hypothetical protein
MPDEDGLDDPEPICGRCGAPVALFQDRGLTWHHFRGAVNTFGLSAIIRSANLITSRGRSPSAIGLALLRALVVRATARLIPI